MWLSVLFAAADDPSTVLPIVGAGGAGLSAVLFFLLLDEKKERRADKKMHEELTAKLLPVMTSIAAMQDRVLAALSLQATEHHDRRPDDPEVLRRAYDQLEQLLDEFPPPSNTRRRARGSERG